MADNTDNSGDENKSFLKSAFQWAAAVTAPFACEAPQRSYEQAGQAYDYVKTWVGAHRAPKAG